MNPQRRVVRPRKLRARFFLETLETRETISDAILGPGLTALALPLAESLSALASPAPPKITQLDTVDLASTDRRKDLLTDLPHGWFLDPAHREEAGFENKHTSSANATVGMGWEGDLFSTLDQELATLLSFDFAKAARAAVASEDALPVVLPPAAGLGNGETGGSGAAPSANGGDGEGAGFRLTITSSLPTDQAGLEAITGSTLTSSGRTPRAPLGSGVLGTPPLPAYLLAPTPARSAPRTTPPLVRPQPPTPPVSRPGTLQPSTPTGLSPSSGGGGAMSSSSCSGVVLTSTTLDIGVNQEGHLITCDGMGGDRGLKYYNGSGNPDVLNQGTLAEGWGIKDALTGVNGYANRSQGVSNLTLESFTSTTSTATSKVKVKNGSGQDVFRVTQNFNPLAASNKVYEITVDITNLSAANVDLRYRRVMDWDATSNGEFVTVQTNGNPCVTITNNDGMATAQPGGSYTSTYVSPVIFGDFDTRGQADQGALFEFNFGTLGASQTKTVKFFYGAADSRTEAEKLLDDAGADAFSICKDTNLDTGPTFMFGVDCDDGMPAALAPETNCGCDGAGELMETSSHLGGNSGGMSGQSGVRADDGVFATTAHEFGSSGFGTAWGQTRSWSNGANYAGRGTNGMGMVNTFLPRLVRSNGGNTMALITNATTAHFYDYASSIWTPRYFGQETVSGAPGASTFTLKDTAGNELSFHGFTSSIPVSQRGQLISFTDSANLVTSATYTNGQLTKMQRSTGSGMSEVVESYTFAYLTYSSSESNTGRVQSVTLERQIGGGSWQTVRKTSYSYYDGALPDNDPTKGTGVAGDLMLAEVKDASSTILDTFYYRYHAPLSSTGYMHGLKYEFSPQSFARVWSATGNPLTALDSAVAPYADRFAQYDAARRVSQIAVQGAGCSACTGGLGTYTYTYSTSTFSNGFNNWSRKVIETLPDHEGSGNVSQNVIYTNYAGEPMLKIYENGSSSSPNRWRTFYQYDSAGRVTLMANPSAITGHSEGSANLGVTFHSSSGLIQTTEHGSSNSATATTAGDAIGYVKRTKLQRGESGTPVVQGLTQYFSRTDASGAKIYPVANQTRYRNTNETGGQTTSYAYTWHGSTTQMESLAVTQPTVTTEQNGPNTSVAETSFFDTFGRLTWHKDADGFLTYNAYDSATSAVIKTIADVDTDNTSDFTGLPSGWSNTTGLHLITQREVDTLGRVTKLTEPAPDLRVTYTVYKDTNHEVRTYPGWNSSTLTPTGPTQVSIEYRPGYSSEPVYFENLTMTATPAVSDGKPTGGETIDYVWTLSRSYTSAGGQTSYADRYFGFNSMTYSSAPNLGTEGTNYHRTRFAYDSRGRQNRVQTPTSTIQRTVYDSLSRVVSTWVGTNDTVATGSWSPANRESPLNMVQVSASVYDGTGDTSGVGGDSNLTRSIQYPTGRPSGTEEPSDRRVTDFFYDWRNRQVASKSGVQASESTDTQRPIFYTEYDNLSQTIATEQYDGDNVTITTTSGVPDKPSSTLRRARSENLFDERGRVYRSKTFSVNQSDGTLSSTALTSDTWFNHRGQTIKTAQPGGLVSKSEYDGVGRLKKSYTTDGQLDLTHLTESSWIQASHVNDDLVLTQAEPSYDGSSNVIQTITRQRFHDETATGALQNPTTTPKARRSYAANYFDRANRTTASVDVGTNGGSAWTRPSSVPTRSDTELVTTINYNSPGWVAEVLDPRAISTQTGYDNAGRVVLTVEAFVDGVPSNNDDRRTEYTYDGSDHMLTLTAVEAGGTTYQRTQWVYGMTATSGNILNSNDLLKETRYPDKTTGNPSTATGDVESYKYNALGQATERKDRNQSVHEYTFDVLGRPLANKVTTFGSGVNNTVKRLETAYDTAGRPFRFSSYDAASGGNVLNQVERGYNGLSQLITEYQSHSGAVNTMSTPKVQYTYSEMASSANHSRMTGLIYPNSRTVTSNYASGLDNTISRLSSLTDGMTTLESCSYLGLDTVVERKHPEPNVNLTYLITGTSDGGDQYVGLDRFGRVVEQRWDKMGNATDRFQYTYDRDSNRLTKTLPLPPTSKNETYGYDLLNQLTSFAQGSTHTQGWTLDALGNWSTFTNDSVPQARTHNRQNQVTQVGSNNLTFDNNGNTTTDDTGKTLTYDAWNRVMSVTAGANTVSFTYDALTRRLTETKSNTTTDLYYSAEWQVLEERIGSSINVQQVWSPVYVDAMVLRDRDANGQSSDGLEERLYPQQDGNWNVTALVDATGNVMERYVEDPYGKVTVLTASWADRGATLFTWVYLHQGGRFESLSNLYYFRNRDLSPTLGRWVQRDPIEYMAGDSNLYRFVHNRPVDATDSSGLEISPPGGDWLRWLQTHPFLHKPYSPSVSDEKIGSDAINRVPSPIDVVFPQSSIHGQMELDATYKDTGILGKFAMKSPTLSAHAQQQLGDATIGPVFSFRDREKGKDCCGGKGDRVWVSFVYTLEAEMGILKQEEIAAALAAADKPLKTWRWDWGPWPNLSTTNEEDWLDWASNNAGKNESSFRTKELIFLGIACRSKKNQLLFQKELVDWGIIYYEYSWNKKSGIARVWAAPGYYDPGADHRGQLVNDGKWIEKMPKGAEGGLQK